jgi:predicted nucleic-acid-binding protein
LVRYFLEEAQADAATQRQREAARKLLESGQVLFLPKTVALELEWVLRGYYGFGVERVLQVLDQLQHHACLEVEDRPALEQAVAQSIAPSLVFSAGTRVGYVLAQVCTVGLAAR